MINLKEIVSSPERVNVETNNTVEEKPVVLENKEEENIEITKRRYFSFEARIVVSILAILVLFVGACFLGLKVINHTTTQRVNYLENGDFTYQVCLKNATCAPENTTYTADDINIIKVSFKYDAKYEKKIKYNNNYRVSAIVGAYSKDTNALLYKKENDLVDQTAIDDDNDNYSINEIVTIDFAKYKELLEYYPNTNKQVEVVLYLEENNETRKVASLLIPLSKDTFELNKYTTINTVRAAKVKVNMWDTYSLVYTIATSFLTLISLILIYRTTRLVLKVTNNRNEYEEAVDELLREYDNIIVIARDGYEALEEREVIKINEFSELVKVRDGLNKPIIFSRVNNVKCEFIVEDETVLYKYTIKEADFTDK